MTMKFMLPIVMLLLAFVGWHAETAAKGPEKPKPDKISWGKEVNGLAVSIAPNGDDQGRFLIRWKNCGKDSLELPWVRFDSDPAYKHLDDLLNHVFLKKADAT